MKKSVKRTLSLVAAIAMLSTSAMAASAASATELKNTDAVSVASVDAIKANADADVLVVGNATSVMEEAALAILKEQTGAERADREAILEAVSKMDQAQLKTVTDNTTKAIADSEELKNAVEEAVKEVSDIAAAAKANEDFDGTVVISNVYNPIDAIKGGELVEAAKKAVQVYVDNVNAKIEAAAKETGAVVADVATANKVEAISADEISADKLNAVIDAQNAAKVNAVADTKVNEVTVQEKFGADFAFGDLNKDGKVKAVDLVIMLQYKLGSLTDADKASYSEKAGDLDKDGKSCTMTDIAMLKSYLLGDISADDLGKVNF